jgi:hypothetical protein
MMFEALVHVQKREKMTKVEEEAKGKKGKVKKFKGNQKETQPPPENHEAQNATPVNQEEEEDDASKLTFDYKRNTFKPTTIKLLCKYFEDKEVCDTIRVDGLVRLFFGVVVNILLLPSNTNVVTAPRLQQLRNLDKLKGID